MFGGSSIRKMFGGSLPCAIVCIGIENNHIHCGRSDNVWWELVMYNCLHWDWEQWHDIRLFYPVECNCLHYSQNVWWEFAMCNSLHWLEFAMCNSLHWN